MTKQLYYPNGMPVPLRDVWDVIDQLGLTLVQSHQHKAEAKKNNWEGSFGLSASEEELTISNRERLLSFLISIHGDKISPQAKYTVVLKEKNEANRHYRQGEFRLFIGEYSTFIVELGITEDKLDIDPKAYIRVIQVLDDEMFRKEKSMDEQKKLLKEYIKNNS